MGLAELIKDYVERTVEYKIYSHEPDEDGYMSTCSAEQKAMEDAFVKLKIYIEKYEQKMLMEAIPDEFLSKIRDLPFVKSIEFGEFYDCNNLLVRISDMSIQNIKKIHEMEYDFLQNFDGYINILVLPVLEEFKAKDEDELLDVVTSWVESDKEWDKGGEWVYPKGARKKP